MVYCSKSYCNESTYTLLSQDSIFSKTTKMFGQQTNVIRRRYVVDKSINSSSTPSGNFLFENYEFNFIGEITLTENCPQNRSIVSKHWTFNYHIYGILQMDNYRTRVIDCLPGNIYHNLQIMQKQWIMAGCQ